MPEPIFERVTCRVESGTLIATFKDAQITGDELADALREELLAALEHFGPAKMIIDFENVVYLSSAGFRPLLGLHRKTTERGCRMMFCNLKPDIAEVFTVTRLISPNPNMKAPFQTAPTLADALARLKHHSSRVEHDILIITLADKQLHGEELADALVKELLETVSAAKTNKVIIDMRSVESISTPCMRPLLSIRSHLKSSGGRVCLCNLSEFVAEVLTVTRLISPSGPAPLEHAADVPEAMKMLAG